MDELTPMMKQWKSLKDSAPDALLLFRLGDFYEAFNDDAKIISKELDLTLTKRQDSLMCGVPFHAYEVYLDRLIAKGYKVAIAEQMQDPSQVKGLVDRQIVKILSPGAIIGSNVLKDKTNNFFVSLSQISRTYGLAVLDLSTSEFYVIEIEDEKELINEIFKLKPSELLLSRKFKTLNSDLFERLKNEFNYLINEKDEWYFEYEFAYDKLINHFNTSNLDVFGMKGYTSAVNAAGALISYLSEDLCFNLEHIKTIKTESLSSYMQIDYSTLKNLEILETNNDLNKNNTLINLLDKTSTPMGGRLLKKWIKNPLLNIDKIVERQSSIEEILKNFEVFLNVQTHLGNIRDLQRLLIKIINQSASPRDLTSLRMSLSSVPPIKKLLENLNSKLIKENSQNLSDISPLLDLLEKALVELPPIRLSDGNIFKKGYNLKLDELTQINDNSVDWLNKYQEELKEITNIRTLKVKYNKVFGYFIEISKGQSDKAPVDFIRRQTLVNCERYVTEKLKEYEEKALSAEENIKKLEAELFNDLRQKILTYSKDIENISDSIAIIDVLLSFGLAAKAYNYTKPIIDPSDVIQIIKGRHPVIESAKACGEFIANDCYLNNTDTQLMLITGPNMAGKSTYIRQVALLVIMAQLGSYIPAQSAKIGIVDKVFSRVGASDDLARGQSTFMVEMSETANILNNATKKSLIILDEIGRGTSTYDGISIAWAVAEYLLTQEQKKAKTLFATHYFELTQLEKELKGVVNYTVAVKESDSKVVFLRKIIKGSADKSYGIHVAKLANMPYEVIKKAEERLLNLEMNATNANKNPPSKKEKKQDQFVLFDLNNEINEKIQNVVNEIKQLDVNNLTPMQALQTISYLKQNLDK
ncbi:MAG: DNA mismatch repair protein MutS [Parachlamydiales bacterium]|jgi:DNA mismatch repair protein MutS